MATLAQISKLRQQVEVIEKATNKNRPWKWKSVPVSEEERIMRLNYINEVLRQKYADEKLLATNIMENDPDVDVRVIQDFLDGRELSINKLSTITLNDIPAEDIFPDDAPIKWTPEQEKKNQEFRRLLDDRNAEIEAKRLEKNPRYKNQLPFLPSPKFPFPSNRFLINLSHLDERNDSATKNDLVNGRGYGWCEAQRQADKRYYKLDEEKTTTPVAIPLETVNNCHPDKSVPRPTKDTLDDFEAWLGEDNED
ncbi:MAG: hypothetical protein N4J56_002508 [Chroococcidiopsis sp. SAG 2025]|uniref:hypothetical protein n=1 Tax=Chroococcidiopsis sp. SAG 2025 TaxID=171389 RepID=UPI00293727DE|nr:hypothetical protein [Chroococcidiopsis sp. SAG 2025]MDV2992854.1 hypothetical protein [Chroococcidiopsis sp. SAG 2025]